MTAADDDLKQQGNKAFSAGQYNEAISFFSQAIDLDPSNHVLYSNRSASYANLKDYVNALQDAEKTIALNSSWAKGYSRSGAALFGLNKLDEAANAYKEGLKYDPENAVLKRGLEEVESARMHSVASNPFAKIFSGDVLSKIASNPKISHFLADPSVVEKVKAIQANPNLINMYLQDQSMMQLIIGMMGIDASFADAPQDQPQNNQPQRDQPKEQPPVVVEKEEELPSEEMEKRAKRARSDEEKEMGNVLYKKRSFDDALVHYEKAFELDNTNIAVLTNKSAVLFEMNNFNECIKVCEQAVELGREIFADFKVLARAYGRMGNAYAKLDDLENAIKYLNKSLAEHRTADVLTKLRELEKLKKEKDIEAYRDPVLSEQSRERGNALFKAGKFSEAVKEYTEAIKRNDSDPRHFTNRAACLMKLLAFPEADKDCDKALALDPKFVKAYIRKAAILFSKKDYMKAIDMCNEARLHDTDRKHAAEIDNQIAKCYAGLNEVQHSSREEVSKKAMENPEVREVMADPVMQQILQQMQTDPGAAQDHMKNPLVAAKIRTLINAGVIRVA